MENTGFQGKNLARVVTVFENMARDPNIAILFGYAGSLSTTGQWKIINWLLENNLIDILVPTGANISEDIVEAMGGAYIQSTPNSPDEQLFQKGYNRYYDVIGSEKEYMDMTELIAEFIQILNKKHNYSSREFLYLFGLWLSDKGIESIVSVAAKNNVPIFCPAFTDSSAGFGLVMHQEKNPKHHITIDSVREFRELTEIKIQSKGSGLFMIGGGVPKNFIQDTVICAELLGKKVDMHKYAIQITVADSRDGACSSSTLKEASSWGKVNTSKEQMVFAEATSVLPLIASDAYHRKYWKQRHRKNFSKIFG